MCLRLRLDFGCSPGGSRVIISSPDLGPRTVIAADFQEFVALVDERQPKSWGVDVLELCGGIHALAPWHEGWTEFGLDNGLRRHSNLHKLQMDMLVAYTVFSKFNITSFF